MRHFIILIFLWIISLSQTAAALNTFKAKIIDGDSGEPLIGRPQLWRGHNWEM